MSINEFGEPSSGRNKRAAKPGEVAPPPKQPHGARGKLDEVAERLRKIEQVNDAMQAQFAVASPSYNQCERIDDLLHEAYGLLGE